MAQLLEIMKRKRRFIFIPDVRFWSMVSYPCIVSGYVEKVARKERKEDVRFLIISSRICLTVTHLPSLLRFFYFPVAPWSGDQAFNTWPLKYIED